MLSNSDYSLKWLIETEMQNEIRKSQGLSALKTFTVENTVDNTIEVYVEDEGRIA